MTRLETLHISPRESKKSTGEIDDRVFINSHPMAASVGEQDLETIRAMVNGIGTKRNIWNVVDSYTPYLPALIQMYSDKSGTTLKTSPFRFYPVHFTVLNFNYISRKRHIMNDRTIVGYLPCTFHQSMFKRY